MAAAPQTDPSQGMQGAPPQGGAPPDPSQGTATSAPASPDMMKLAQIFQYVQQLAQTNPVLQDGAQMVMQGVQKMNAAMVSQPQQPQPMSQNPPV